MTCRVLRVSASGYYEWRGRAPSLRSVADAALTAQIREIHTMSRGSYGVPRVHAELRLGCGVHCGRKRVARLMRAAKLHGIYVRRKRRGYPQPPVHDDLVRRHFVADAPNRLWLTDITEHPTREGKVYLAAVLDVYARRIVGWSIADHLRAELVVDALEMAKWRRRPQPGQTVLHSDRGSQYTSWAFGHRLRDAGLLGSMGRVGSAYDNAMMESFWGTLSSSSSIVATGTRGASSPRPSSSGSRPGTTRGAVTPRSMTSAPSSSSDCTHRPQVRHDF